MRIVIVLPTYNERENIGLLIPALEGELAKVPHDAHILVVDDNSPDGTAAEVSRQKLEFENLHLITGEKQGLGAAYVRGMKYAIEELGADAVMEMDADFSHRVEDVPRLIEELSNGYDLVIGSRYVKDGQIADNWSIFRRVNSWGANIVARALAGLWSVEDCTAGFRAIKADLLKRIELDQIKSKGYSFQVQLLYQALKRGAKIKEVPVLFVDRVRGQTKLGLNVKERLDFLLDILAIRFEKLEYFLKFAAIGASGVVVNLGTFYLLTRQAGLQGELASPMAVELSIISNFIGNNCWTFSSSTTRSPLAIKFLKFNAVSLMALLINYSLFLALHQLLNVHDLVAQSLGILAAVGWNYIVNVSWTWRMAES